MRARGSVAVSILAGVLVGCADQPAPSEPTLDQRSAGATERIIRFEPPSPREAEVLELTAGARRAMTRSLTAALVELDIRPDASMSMLDDFFQRVEAQHAERRKARADLPPTIHP